MIYCNHDVPMCGHRMVHCSGKIACSAQTMGENDRTDSFLTISEPLAKLAVSGGWYSNLSEGSQDEVRYIVDTELGPKDALHLCYRLLRVIKPHSRILNRWFPVHRIEYAGFNSFISDLDMSDSHHVRRIFTSAIDPRKVLTPHC